MRRANQKAANGGKPYVVGGRKEYEEFLAEDKNLMEKVSYDEFRSEKKSMGD